MILFIHMSSQLGMSIFVLLNFFDSYDPARVLIIDSFLANILFLLAQHFLNVIVVKRLIFVTKIFQSCSRCTRIVQLRFHLHFDEVDILLVNGVSSVKCFFRSLLDPIKEDKRFFI